MQHNTGHTREFRVHKHEFVITHNDIGMLEPNEPDLRGYVCRSKLSPAVIQWLEERNVKYFVRGTFFQLNLSFEEDDVATLFKLTWGL